MRIIEAEIFNFGKLHDQKISFDEKLNTILHENGWGKTTLSVFITAMLYGMETTTVRDITKNEKKKYAPWQGGTYGGTLTFEHAGKKYRVSRTFGTKANEDAFELIDLGTNQQSSDFSGNLGNELFGVSRETYARSAYVTLDEVPVNTAEVSAKLNNLVEADDVSSFDRAVEVLEGRAHDLKGVRGGKGVIPEIEKRIEEDHGKLDEIKALLKQNDGLAAKIADETSHRTDVEQKQELVTRQLSDWAKFEKKSRYEQLKADVAAAIAEKEKAEAFFNGNIPSAETVSNIDSLCTSYNTVASNIQTQSATQAEKDEYDRLGNYFAGDIPTTEQINTCLNEDQKYRNFRQDSAARLLTPAEAEEFDRLNLKFQNDDVSEQIINSYVEKVGTVQEKKAELAALKTKAEAREVEIRDEMQKKPDNKVRKFLFIAGGIVFAAGVALFILKMKIPGIAVAAAGAVACIAGLFIKGKKQDFTSLIEESNSYKRQIEGLAEDIRKDEELYKTFTAKYAPGATSELVAFNTITAEYGNYSRLLKKKQEYDTWLSGQKKPEEYEAAIKSFMKRYCKNDDISSVAADIQGLTAKLNRLDELKKLINSDAVNSESIAGFSQKLDAALADFRTDKTKSYSEQVHQLRDNLAAVSNYRKNVETAEANLKVLLDELQGDVSSLEKVTKPEKTNDELKALMQGYSNEINGRNTNIANYQKQITDNLTVTDTQNDIESEMEELKALKAEKTAENALYLKTLDLLKQAKDTLDRQYSSGMIDGFNKYISMLGADLPLTIDKDLNVSVDEKGKLRERGFLSEGYKDMVNFCARMALVDALYENEKPPVILDDPFVNLDDAKVPKALALVKELSKDNQVIYFACHESRKVE